MSLRVHITLLLTMLVVISIAGISGTQVYRLRSDLESELTSWDSLMREELVSRGKAVANNAALSIAPAVESMEFLFVAEVVKNVTTHDPEVVYGFLADKDGKILVHSDPTKAGGIVGTEERKVAIAGQQVGSRSTTINGKEGIEIVAPVIVDKFVWGTLHFGVSLEHLNATLGKAREQFSGLEQKAIQATGMVGGALLLLTLVMGMIAAHRISSPLRSLAAGLERIRAGDNRHLIRGRGCREFAFFGLAINELTNRELSAEQELSSSVGELQRTLDEAQNASKSKDEFLATVSHELNTPLNAILTVPRSLVTDYRTMDVWHCSKCDAIFERERSDVGGKRACPDCGSPMSIENRLVFTGDAAEHMHIMLRVRNATEHMRRIVQSFNEYSQLSEAQLVPKFEQVRVRDLIEDLRAIVAPLAADKKIELTLPALDDKSAIRADHTMISQALVNVVANAVKFTPNGGSVALDIQADRSLVRFRVQDTGIGLAPDHLEQIFNAFYQVEGGHTRSFGGTGLGLSITRKLVELHGGRVWAESAGRGAGRGSTFTVELPRGEA